MCKCLARADKALAARNTSVVTSFNLRGQVFPVIATETVTKKRGSRPALLIPSYCPFCGRKYEVKGS